MSAVAALADRLETAIDMNLSKIESGRGIDQPRKLREKLESITRDMRAVAVQIPAPLTDTARRDAIRVVLRNHGLLVAVRDEWADELIRALAVAAA